MIKLTTELNHYYDAGLEFIKIRDKNSSEVNNVVPDPLNWWLTIGRILYPILAKIALDLFSIPAMSSACEQAFSQAKKVVTDERNKLAADTIETNQCQKWWLLKGLLPSSLINCVGSNQCCIETPETETGTCLSLLKQNSPFHIRVSIRFRSIYRIKGS